MGPRGNPCPALPALTTPLHGGVPAGHLRLSLVLPAPQLSLACHRAFAQSALAAGKNPLLLFQLLSCPQIDPLPPISALNGT